jgi:hypothetical protein
MLRASPQRAFSPAPPPPKRYRHCWGFNSFWFLQTCYMVRHCWALSYHCAVDRLTHPLRDSHRTVVECDQAQR